MIHRSLPLPGPNLERVPANLSRVVEMPRRAPLRCAPAGGLGGAPAGRSVRTGSDDDASGLDGEATSGLRGRAGEELPELPELHGELRKLLEHGRDLQRACRSTERIADARSRLLDPTLRTLGRALDWMGRMEALAAGAQGGDGSATGLADLGELCAMAAIELRSHRALLEQLADEPAEADVSWRALVRIEAAIEAIGDALAAAEGEVSSLRQVRPKGSCQEDLELDLQIRALVGRFRYSIRRAQEEAPVGPGRCELILKRLGSALVWLRGCDKGQSLRLTDRWMADQLGQRVNDLMRGQPLDEVAGRRILEEALIFSSLLEKATGDRRLAAHDGRRIPELIARLEAAVEAEAELEAQLPARPAGAALRRELRVLQGRDEGLDGLLLGGASLVEILEALYQLSRQHRQEGSEDPRAAVPTWS